MLVTPDNGGMRADIYTNERKGTRRLKVSDGSSCFDEGRQFRISWEFTVSTTPQVIRFESPIPFILRKQSLAVDDGGVRWRAFRVATEGGNFDTAINTTPSNSIPPRPYTQQATVTTGGTISNTGPATETIRMRTSGATAQRTTVGVSKSDFRQLDAGAYYLLFERLGNNDATGVFDLEWTEVC